MSAATIKIEMKNPRDLENEIKDFISSAAKKTDIAHDVPLIKAGYIVSLQFIELILFLEKKFSISIGAYDASPENFDTIAHIAKFVLEKREGGKIKRGK